MADVEESTSGGLHFVVSTGVEKPDPQLRKFIRSHVMLGKNLGRPRPDRRKKRKPEKSQSPSESTTSHSSGSDTDVVPIPPRMGYETSALQFAEFVEPGTVDIVLRLSSISKQVMFVLEPCLLFERRAERWVAPLAFDPLYLHTMIFSAHFYFNAFRPNKASLSSLSQQAAPHYSRAVTLLRERLADGQSEMRLCDTTLAVVMTLANVALWTDDFELARHHIEGLARMFTLRGYASMSGGSAKLLVEILRADLGLSLHCGSRPVFLDNPTFRKHLLLYPDLRATYNLPKSTSSPTSLKNSADRPTSMDARLVQVWTVLSDFCEVVNRAVATKQYITAEVLLDTVAPVMFNLLDMRFGAWSTDEAMRLGLLAFSCSIFMYWRTMDKRPAQLTAEFRGCLQNSAIIRQLPPQLLLWLLVVGAVSVLGVTDDDKGWLESLLGDTVQRCGIKSWGEAQQLMGSLLWTDLVHDTPGRSVFRSVGVW